MGFKGADASGCEEDARVTAMWLWTLFAGEEPSETATQDEDADDEAEDSATVPKGYVLEYDAARKIAQGLGATLESLTSVVEIKGDMARLVPVAERTRKLFRGEDGETAPVRRRRVPQLELGFVA